MSLSPAQSPLGDIFLAPNVQAESLLVGRRILLLIFVVQSPPIWTHFVAFATSSSEAYWRKAPAHFVLEHNILFWGSRVGHAPDTNRSMLRFEWNKTVSWYLTYRNICIAWSLFHRLLSGNSRNLRVSRPMWWWSDDWRCLFFSVLHIHLRFRCMAIPGTLRVGSFCRKLKGAYHDNMKVTRMEWGTSSFRG